MDGLIDRRGVITLRVFGHIQTSPSKLRHRSVFINFVTYASYRS